jgi:hypothetical protein
MVQIHRETSVLLLCLGANRTPQFLVLDEASQGLSEPWSALLLHCGSLMCGFSLGVTAVHQRLFSFPFWAKDITLPHPLQFDYAHLQAKKMSVDTMCLRQWSSTCDSCSQSLRLLHWKWKSIFIRSKGVASPKSQRASKTHSGLGKKWLNHWSLVVICYHSICVSYSDNCDQQFIDRVWYMHAVFMSVGTQRSQPSKNILQPNEDNNPSWEKA